MAVDSMLVDTLVAEVNFRITGSQTTDSALDASIRRALDWALRDFVRSTQPQSFSTQGTVTLTAGTSAYDLPDDLDMILPDGVRFNASPYTTLNRMTRAQYDRHGFATSTGQSRPTHYITLGRSTSSRAARIQFWPTPDTTSVVVQVNYHAFPAKIWDSTSGGGTLIDPRFPPTHWWDLVDGALTKFPNYINEPQRMAYERNFKLAKESMRSNASLMIGEGTRPDPMGMGGYDYVDDLYDTTVT